MVDAACYQLQVLLIGVAGNAGDIEVRKSTVHMQACLLTHRSGTKDSNYGHLLHWAGPEVRVAYVHVFNRWRGVVVNGDDATAEGAGRQGRRERRGGAMPRVHVRSASKVAFPNIN